jgi:serine/threonine protein kinase
MAPEQARGEAGLTERADQYGLGIVLWELLHGQRFYTATGDDLWREMRRASQPHMHGAPRVPPELLEIVSSLLQPSPANRCPSMSAVASSLQTLSSNAESGRRPLGALVSFLVKDPNFDPFDRAADRAQSLGDSQLRAVSH